MLLLLSVIPIYLMLVVSFKNPLQYLHERWVISLPLRIRNYVAAWDMVGSYIWNTFFVAIVGFLGMASLSTVSAYVFACMRFPFREHLFYAIIALLLVPWVLSFVPAYMVYNDFGLIDTYWALIIPRIVNGSIFGIFLLRAFFAGLPEEIFEAARIDGAGHWPLIFHITIPMSMTVIATLAALDFINALERLPVAFCLYQFRVAPDDLRGPFISCKAISPGPAGVRYLRGIPLLPFPWPFSSSLWAKFYIEGLVESGLKT